MDSPAVNSIARVNTRQHQGLALIIGVFVAVVTINPQAVKQPTGSVDSDAVCDTDAAVVLLQTKASFVDPQTSLNPSVTSVSSDDGVSSGDLGALGAHFVLARSGTNECPTDYKSIGDEWSCKKAMTALAAGSFGRKASWVGHPGGCFKDQDGFINVNNNLGAANPASTPLCERDVEFGKFGEFEARDAEGNWWPVNITSRSKDGTYSLLLENGLQWPRVWQFNVRRTMNIDADSELGSSLPNFALGTYGANSCPRAYKNIGDEWSCKRAMLALALGPFGRKASLPAHPAGCFVDASGVSLNNNTGAGKDTAAPICEKDFSVGQTDGFEAKDAAGEWLKVNITGKSSDGSYYSVSLEDGTQWSRVWEFNVRRVHKEAMEEMIAVENDINLSIAGENASAMDSPFYFVVAQNGSNSCPFGYKTIGDDFSCLKAMNALSLAPFGREASWSTSPGGCFLDATGTVNLNRHTGASKSNDATICEKDFPVGAESQFEARDSLNQWWPVTIISQNEGKSYSVALADGSQWPRVWQFNVRRSNREDDENSKWGSSLSEFTMGAEGSNDCPLSYKSIGDEFSCKKALFHLAVGSWGTKSSMPLQPGGCFLDALGRVNLNNNTGAAKLNAAPICERDFQLDVANEFETRDDDGIWWPCTLIGKNKDSSYSLVLDDADQWGGDPTQWSRVWQFNVRRSPPGSHKQVAAAVASVDQTAHAEDDAPIQDATADSSTSEDSPTDMLNSSDQTTAVLPDVSGSFILGSDGANECPTDYVAIADEQMCQMAMASLSLGPWGRADSWDDHPSGCFRNPKGDVYFNSQPGSGKVERAPVCMQE